MAFRHDEAAQREKEVNPEIAAADDILERGRRQRLILRKVGKHHRRRGDAAHRRQRPYLFFHPRDPSSALVHPMVPVFHL